MRGPSDSIPIFTASGGMSSNTASICCPTTAGSMFCEPITRAVFSATTDTITLMP